MGLHFESTKNRNKREMGPVADGRFTHEAGLRNLPTIARNGHYLCSTHAQLAKAWFSLCLERHMPVVDNLAIKAARWEL